MNKPIIKVLIVEDDLLSQMVAKTLLQQLACDADVAKSEQEALEKSNNLKYNLILMDIGLGNSDGFMVTKKIKNNSTNQTTPIVALTAHHTKEHQLQAESVGMAEFMTKPLEKDKVLELLVKYTSYSNI